MKKMKVEGNITESRQVKERGRVKGYESSHEGSGNFADQEVCNGMRMIGFEAGRTIELRRFEFCRIRLWIKVYLPDGIEKDDVQDAEENFINSMLSREEAAVVENDYDGIVSDDSIGILSKCVCRSIGVLYGLTLKSGKNEFESDVVDIIEERPISDEDDLLDAFEQLSDEMAAKLDYHHNRIKYAE
jgi:hypothetical protein